MKWKGLKWKGSEGLVSSNIEGQNSRFGVRELGLLNSINSNFDGIIVQFLK